MRILVIKSHYTLKDERKEEIKAEIRKDIENGGFIFLNGPFESYVADIDVKSEPMFISEGESEPPVEEEIKGCRYSACRHYTTYHDQNSLLTKMKCACGNTLAFDKVCKDFEP